MRHLLECKQSTKIHISNYPKSTKFWSKSDGVTKLWSKSDLTSSYSDMWPYEYEENVKKLVGCRLVVVQERKFGLSVPAKGLTMVNS